jgi:hypothetical protein
MMDCKHYRAALLADPAAVTAEMRDHGSGCAACAQFTQRIQAFEARLQRAVRLPLPEARDAGRGASVSPLPVAASASGRRVASRTLRWTALAASFIAAISVGGLLWLAVPRSSLAGDVVNHMAEEPEAWRRTTAVVSPAALDAVMQDAHMHLSAATAGLVSYASSCGFRGHQVPHLVVQDPSGPVTVMVLVHESARSPDDFDEQGYRGEILPVPGHGAIAILTRNQRLDAAALDRIAQQLRAAIRWTN